MLKKERKKERKKEERKKEKRKKERKDLSQRRNIESKEKWRTEEMFTFSLKTFAEQIK